MRYPDDVDPHDDDSDDDDSGASLNAVAYVGLAFREAKDKYRPTITADFQAYLRATITGSTRTDQSRFNVMGEFGAVYFSLDPDTPARELERTYRKRAGTDQAEDISVGRILVTVALHLSRVTDLRDPHECELWGIAPESVTADDLRPCQAVAREVRRSYEAIRYPSATGQGENLALFFDRLLVSSTVALLDVQPLQPPME